ncbi:MAG: ABC transporter permease [Candidatus Marinimicrobia bacterium]|nr:ABC transporter permease [Candidatus Neomarinimicrobiota bacterium]
MRFTTILAKKFLKGRTGPGKFTGIISMIGMAVGSFAMIVSIAVMNGFESRVSERLRGFDGDIRISGFITQKVIDQISELEGIESFIPFIERKGILSSKSSQHVIIYKALNMDDMGQVYNINMDFDKSNPKGIIIGKSLSYRMNLSHENSVEIFSPLDMSYGFGYPPMIKSYVSGIFQSQVLDYDERIVFIPIEIGKKIFKKVKGFTGIDIRCHKDENIDIISQELTQVIGNKFKIETWKEQHSSLVQAMELERLMALIVLSLIIVVAGFNLASTLSLVTIQRINEIGILQAIGAPKSALRKMLFIQGFILGGKGTMIGVILGGIVVIVQNQFGLIPLPSDIYFIQTLPMELTGGNLIIIPSISCVIIFISSYIASRKASSIEPKLALTWNK